MRAWVPWRAVAVGALVGTFLSAGNVYMGLTLGWVDSGNITATLLGFALLSLWAKGTATAEETNLAQTAAVIAAGMCSAGALVSALPALFPEGAIPSGWLLFAWTGFSGTCGVVLASRLRPRLIESEQLPFPTGVATAELIRMLHLGRASLGARMAALGGASSLSAVVVWFRDGVPAIIPAALALPGPAAALGFGLYVAPMVLGAGVLVGIRAGASVCVGSLLGFGILVPQLHAHGILADTSYSVAVQTLVWPGVALILGASAVGLFRSRALFRGSVGLVSNAEVGRSGLLLLAVSAVGLLATGSVLSDASWLALGFSAVAAVVLCGVVARSAGQVDIAPTGAVGQLTQVGVAAIAPGSVASSLVGASVVSGTSGQVANSLWCLKSGHLLGAPLRPQLRTHLLAVWFGAAVTVGFFILLVRAHGLFSAELPAPGVVMAKGIARALSGGGGALPQSVLWMTAVHFLAGAGLELSGRSKWVPLALALGIGYVIPPSMSGTLFVGALLAFLASRKVSESMLAIIATGAIAGEALVGLVIAGLRVLGVLG